MHCVSCRWLGRCDHNRIEIICRKHFIVIARDTLDSESRGDCFGFRLINVANHGEFHVLHVMQNRQVHYLRDCTQPQQPNPELARTAHLPPVTPTVGFVGSMNAPPTRTPGYLTLLSKV